MPGGMNELQELSESTHNHLPWVFFLKKILFICRGERWQNPARVLLPVWVLTNKAGGAEYWAVQPMDGRGIAAHTKQLVLSLDLSFI